MALDGKSFRINVAVWPQNPLYEGSGAHFWRISASYVTKVPTVSLIFPLDRSAQMRDSGVQHMPPSTKEVCAATGIARATLERWLASGRLHPPQSLKIGAKVFRNWTPRDIERVRRFKEKFFRKGRGRKPKPKVA
jgi:predicted DNA-binding transcriptional regulator AlpA